MLNACLRRLPVAEEARGEEAALRAGLEDVIGALEDSQDDGFDALVALRASFVVPAPGIMAERLGAGPSSFQGLELLFELFRLVSHLFDPDLFDVLLDLPGFAPPALDSPASASVGADAAFAGEAGAGSAAGSPKRDGDAKNS